MADHLGTDTASLFTGSGVDLDPYFRRIRGNEAVMHAVARRFVTRRGSLDWAPDAGLDLRLYLNEGLTPSDLPAISSAVVGEALNDERVLTARARVELDAARSTLTIALEITTSEGPFTLVLSVTALAVALLS